MSESKNIEKLDRNFAPVESAQGTVWYDVKDIGVEGRGWSDVACFYDRLPARAEALVRRDVWSLSQHSTGLFARFVAKTGAISARWTVRSGADGLAMAHMPSTGVSGLDLYGRVDGQWRHAANGRPAGVTTSAALLKDTEPVEREYMLYLPLYNGVESVHVGLPEGVELKGAPGWAKGREKPIVDYGTSVTQGGCASRPGMLHTSILGRWLERPMINLGFSGNGKLELEVARLLTELDPSMYVLSCLGNTDAQGVHERLGPVVRMLREARPGVPILLLGNIPYTNMGFVRASRERYDANNAALREEYGKLMAAGVPGLHLFMGEDVYGDDGEATVDGAHASDLGFWRMAKALLPVFEGVLG